MSGKEEKVTENTVIVENTNQSNIRYHAMVKGSSKMTKPYSRAYAIALCKDMQDDVDAGSIKIPGQTI